MVEVNDTLTIDPIDIERNITPYTRAIMPVHMGNRPCDMEAILAIAKKHELLVVEDACQAVGVKYRDKFCGAIGDAGAFSFNQHKNMTIGEGGAVLLRDHRSYARAFNYHDIGISFRGREFADSDPVFVGMNMRANEIQGAMLNAQLSKLPKRIARMQRRYEVMMNALQRGGFPVAPVNDPENSLGIVITFDTEKDSAAFAERRGASRLFDNTKHVYSNWEPILEKRTFHPKMNPWDWAGRTVKYSADMCPRTLDLLRRSCRVGLGENYPLAVVQLAARAFSKG
jgi:dTDP-4-amino-4,6-dideoxygalactose transaminase